MKDVSNQLATPPQYIAIRSEELPAWEIPSSGESSVYPQLSGQWRRSFNRVGLALSVGAAGMFCSLGAAASPEPPNAQEPPLPRLLDHSQTVPLQAPVLLSAAEIERSEISTLESRTPAPNLEAQESQDRTLEQAENEVPDLKPLAAAVPAPVAVAVADVSQPIQVIPPPEVDVPAQLSLPPLEGVRPEAPTPAQVAAVGLERPVPLTVVKAPEAAPRFAEPEFPPEESQQAPQLPALLPPQRRAEDAELAAPAPRTVSIPLPEAPVLKALNPQTPISIPVIPPLEAASPRPLPQTVAPPVLLESNSSFGRQYQVRVGDTLNSIAKEHGLSPAALIRANGISNPNHLKVSQTLAIPQAQETSLLAEEPGEDFGNTAPARSLSRLQRQYSPREQIIGAAPTVPDAYNDSLQLPLGQEVGPKLPPLSIPDFPEAPTQFTGYIWPAQGVLTSGFGRRWGRMHRGIDIAGPIGTPIMAAAAGYVISSGWNSGGFGNLVKIRHDDGSVTYYAHNHRILVRAGDYVQQGQQIAEMGSTGRSTGPHLHFEIRPDGKQAVNPMTLMASR